MSAYLSVGRKLGPVTLYGLAALTEHTQDRVIVQQLPRDLDNLYSDAGRGLFLRAVT